MCLIACILHLSQWRGEVEKGLKGKEDLVFTHCKFAVEVRGNLYKLAVKTYPICYDARLVKRRQTAFVRRAQ